MNALPFPTYEAWDDPNPPFAPREEAPEALRHVPLQLRQRRGLAVALRGGAIGLQRLGGGGGVEQAVGFHFGTFPIKHLCCFPCGFPKTSKLKEGSPIGTYEPSTTPYLHYLGQGQSWTSRKCRQQRKGFLLAEACP